LIARIEELRLDVRIEDVRAERLTLVVRANELE
jgi:hypothetical protein